MIKSERRWQVMQLLIAVNLLILGVAFYADYNNIRIIAFDDAMTGFQAFSALLMSVNYATKPGDDYAKH